MSDAKMQTFTGEVVSGVGHASERMSPGSVALELYEEATKSELVPGSLNIDVGHEIEMPLYAEEIVREDHEGKAIISITPAFVNNLPGFAIRNRKVEEGTGQHQKNIIEVISAHNLRDELKLQDGDEVTVRL